MARCWQTPGNATEKKKEQEQHGETIAERVDTCKGLFNVYVCAIGALIDRMSPKVDGWGGGDASKNQL